MASQDTDKGGKPAISAEDMKQLKARAPGIAKQVESFLTASKPDRFDRDFYIYPRLLKRWWPNWHVLHGIFHRRDFSAQTASDLLGMTYRQLNDWNKRGFLSFEREGEAGWRRFSALDLYGLAVTKEIKDLGFPLTMFNHHAHGTGGGMIAGHLEEITWESMRFLVDGRPAYFETNFRDEFSSVYSTSEQYEYGVTGKLETKPFYGQKLKIDFKENDTAVTTIGLRRIAKKVFSKLKFDDLTITIDWHEKYSFEIPGKGPLELETFPPDSE